MEGREPSKLGGAGSNPARVTTWSCYTEPLPSRQEGFTHVASQRRETAPTGAKNEGDAVRAPSLRAPAFLPVSVG